MLVTRATFDEIIKNFCTPGFYGLDTETTGLEYHDRLFAIILADAKDGYYFHFEPSTPGAMRENCFPKSYLKKFQDVFDVRNSIWAIHNARFDLKMLEKEKLFVRGQVHCTQVTARLLRNDRMNYSLDACAKLLGLEKDQAVETYIKANKLSESYMVPGKKTKKMRKFFWKVPLDIVSKYGANDAILHRKLADDQFRDLDIVDPKTPELKRLYENEHRLLRVCTTMEDTGIKINREYATSALKYEQGEVERLREDYKKITGTDFIDSNKALEIAFRAQGEEISKTEKGNPTFRYDILKEMNTMLAHLVTDIRTHAMYAGTYYSSFLYFADENDTIHPSMRQDATATGRFSYHEPNMQNVPKEDDEPNLKYFVRSSFVPRPDYCFVPIDYQQQEFKMLLDYAGETELIREILEGKDVHQATADLLGIPRKFAKTINFGLLYGMGVAKLAKALGVDVVDATKLRNLYFEGLPKVRYFMSMVKNTVKLRGFIWNWAGRRYYVQSDYAYIALNHLIQGGCADVVKFAMVELHEFLRPYKTKMICQVHDEILFEVHESELDLVPQLKFIMENIYKPYNGLNLTCSVEYSWKSWGALDKVKGFPHETRNSIQAPLLAAS